MRQAQAESKLTSQDDELRRLRAQVEELARQVQELNGLKAKLTHENFELHRQVQELDSNNAALAKLRAQLQQQLDEAKARLEEETRVSVIFSMLVLFCGFQRWRNYGRQTGANPERSASLRGSIFKQYLRFQFFDYRT